MTQEQIQKNYFKELNEIHEEEKKEYLSELGKKRNVGVYGSGRHLVLLISLFIVVLSVVILFSIYSVIHTTKISNLAGVHVTPAVRAAAKKILQNFQGDQHNSMDIYSNWETYRTDLYHFHYPNDWELKINGNISVRKYNYIQREGFDSLAMSVAFELIDNPENLSLEEKLKKEGVDFSGQEKILTLDGRKAIRIPSKTDTAGVEIESIYCDAGQGKILHISLNHFREHAEEIYKTAEKIVNSVAFANE